MGMSAPVSMPPAATLHFRGFPGRPPGPVLLRDDGDPAGAARQLAGLRLDSPVRDLHRGIASLAQAGALTSAPPPPCLYRYELRLHPRRRAPVWIACWRRYPAGIGWQRRCGPMPLPAFLDRFLERS